jgi:hypothetical protein
MPRTPEYRPFKPEAAARIAKKFGVIEHEDVIYKRVAHATETYARYRNLPDYNHTKDALEKLERSLREIAKLVAKHKRTLKQPLFGTLLRYVGEVLTYEAIEELTGQPARKWSFFRYKVDTENYDQQTKLERSILAAEAGPTIIVSIFQEMQARVQTSLISVKRAGGRGRRIKHLFRLFLIIELAELYEWLFEKRPTSTAQGDFSRFCVAVLEEMDFDLTGIEAAIPIGLKRARYIKSSQNP